MAEGQLGVVSSVTQHSLNFIFVIIDNSNEGIMYFIFFSCWFAFPQASHEPVPQNLDPSLNSIGNSYLQ